MLNFLRIGQALKGQPITVHGDGSQTRSFCYVADLVDGLVRLMESEEAEPVNLGSPWESTVLDVAKAVKHLTKSKSEIVHVEDRPDDPVRRRPDITRARTTLKWEPTTALQEGLRKTIDYFAQKGKGA